MTDPNLPADEHPGGQVGALDVVMNLFEEGRLVYFWADPEADHPRVGSYLFRIDAQYAWAHLMNDDLNPDSSWPLHSIVRADTLPDLALHIADGYLIDDPLEYRQWDRLDQWLPGRCLARILTRLLPDEQTAVLSLIVLRNPTFGLWWDRYTRLVSDLPLLDQARQHVQQFMAEHNDGITVVAPEWLVVTEPDPACWDAALSEVLDQMHAQENPNMHLYR